MTSNETAAPDLTDSRYVDQFNASWPAKPVSMIVIEYHGRGDPFFGGSADDRTLGTDGLIKVRGSPVKTANFATLEEAHAAALRIPNRRADSRLGVAPSWRHDS
jgi:hypothetical protein